MERERGRGRPEPRGATCAACVGPIEGPAVRCPLCARERHGACLSADRRCECGALLPSRVTESSGGTGAELARAAADYARRELWTWLLPLPFILASAWVLATSTRVWTELIIVISRRGGMTEVPAGVFFRPRLILGTLAYAALPPVAAWLAGLHAGGVVTDASPWSSRAAWVARALALAWLAWVATRLLEYR